MNLSTTELKATALHKTIEFLRRKKAYSTIAELAEQVLTQAEKLEQQNSPNGVNVAEEGVDSPDKSLVAKPSSATNAGVKRNRDEADNGGKADGAVKKPSVAAKPGASITNVKPAAAIAQVKSPSTSAASNTVASVNAAVTSTPGILAKPKPATTTTSSFFKSMTGRAQPGSKPATPAVPAPKAQGYASIFDQLRERQKKDEEEAALRAKGGKVAEKEEELTKKGKKKKTVRWKPDNVLEEINIFQVLEPIGEYYGGGDGRGHVFGDARSLDMEEGKDALAALKNRKALEEEDDIYIDWYQPSGQLITPKFQSLLLFVEKFARSSIFRTLCFARCGETLATVMPCVFKTSN
ncbi:hypothetical protein BDZ91DRAFT_527444 [Kalaharituber pfeilii]|nr:hypothetical protein BDZ91DRAFT_527444 [Kalaharituber pfeilii]